MDLTGTAAISSYSVYEGTDYLGDTPDGATSQIAIPALVNGQSYTFSVVANNTQGAGPASNPSAPVMPQAASAPQPPVGISAAATDTGATISWVPADNEATSYVVNSTPSAGGPWTATNTSLQVNGLATGTEYTFTVAAVNSIGQSAAAAAAATPGAPQAAYPVTATAGDGSATISWTLPPSSTTPLTGFLVKGGGKSVTVGPSATSAVLSGLTNGQLLQASVQSLFAGASTTSPSPETVDEVPPVTVGGPTAPTNVGAVVGTSAGNGFDNVTVFWTPPTSASASSSTATITGYSIYSFYSKPNPSDPGYRIYTPTSISTSPSGTDSTNITLPITPVHQHVVVTALTSQTNAQGAHYSAASQNSNALQVIKDATAQSTLWGIDSDANHNHRISTSELASVSADPAVAGLPDVYGRYVGQPVVNGQATPYVGKDINSAELSAATNNNPSVRVALFALNFATNDVTSCAEARAHAADAISGAAALGVADGVTIYGDIEPNTPITADYVQCWYQYFENPVLNPNGYEPGYYENPVGFGPAFCAAVSADPSIGVHPFLWSQQSEPSANPTQKPGPAYAPTLLHCGTQTYSPVGWQYKIDQSFQAGPGTFDSDEASASAGLN